MLLAAGLDSRALWLDCPANVRLFELDLPELFAFKEVVLAEHGAMAGCQRITVGVDLREDWAAPLIAAGFDPAVPTAWLAEGLLPYPTMADNDRLSTPDTRLAFDHMDSSEVNRATMRETADTVRKMGVEWESTLDDPVGWLAGHGWERATAAAMPPLTVGPAVGVEVDGPMPHTASYRRKRALITNGTPQTRWSAGRSSVGCPRQESNLRPTA